MTERVLVTVTCFSAILALAAGATIPSGTERSLYNEQTTENSYQEDDGCLGNIGMKQISPPMGRCGRGGDMSRRRGFTQVIVMPPMMLAHPPSAAPVSATPPVPVLDSTTATEPLQTVVKTSEPINSATFSNEEESATEKELETTVPDPTDSAETVIDSSGRDSPAEEDVANGSKSYGSNPTGDSGSHIYMNSGPNKARIPNKPYAGSHVDPTHGGLNFGFNQGSNCQLVCRNNGHVQEETLDPYLVALLSILKIMSQKAVHNSVTPYQFYPPSSSYNLGNHHSAQSLDQIRAMMPSSSYNVGNHHSAQSVDNIRGMIPSSSHNLGNQHSAQSLDQIRALILLSRLANSVPGLCL